VFAFSKCAGRERNQVVALFVNLERGMSRQAGSQRSECQWLKPVLVGQFEFLEWTGDNPLRYSKFVGLREDKKASDVVRE
jgi:ATP-dependent DNA ligase